MCPRKVEILRVLVRSRTWWAIATLLLILNSGAAPSASSAQPTADCIIDESGDLIDEIRSISGLLPGPGSNGMVVPTTAQMSAWEHLIDATEAGDLTTACSIIAAQGFPYRIMRYTDTGYQDKVYFLLQENVPISVGWGTYLINVDDLRDIVIEVPHPGCELHTEEEGVELFRQLGARGLVIAGTHRCANTSYSPCSGTTSFCGQEEPHRTSDVAHATQTMFHAAHRVLAEPGTGSIAVQIHGCSDSSCPDLFISNTTCEPGELGQRFYRNALSACQGFSVDIADCAPSECSLVGTTNVQGRFSNGSFWLSEFEPCTESSPSPSQPEQFLHLEQSHALRDNFACLAEALRITFSETPRQYLPVITSAYVVQATGQRSGDDGRYPR